MKLKTSILYFFLLIVTVADSQSSDGKDKLAAKKDSMILAKFKTKGASYPVVKESKLSGAMPIANVTDKPVPGMKYKLLFDFVTPTNDPKNKTQVMNRGLAEIGRVINLHIAAGVDPKDLDIVIVTHGKALYSLYNNEAFKRELKTDNPNIAILDEIKNAGATIVACGQALEFLDIKQENLLPSVKIALSAKNALSTYLLKGYVRFDIDED